MVSCITFRDNTVAFINKTKYSIYTGMAEMHADSQQAKYEYFGLSEWL